MTSGNDDWTARLRERLDADADALDPEVLRQLSRRRAIALARPKRRTGLGAYAPGFSFAAAALAIMVFVGLPQRSVNLRESPDLLLELAFVDSDIELIEELDFYRWLDANGHAG